MSQKSIAQVLIEELRRIPPETLRRQEQWVKSWKESRKRLPAAQVRPSIGFQFIEPEFSEDVVPYLLNRMRYLGSCMIPIIVRPRSDGMFEVVVGERYFRLAQQAGVLEIDCFVRELSDSDAAKMVEAVNHLRDRRLNPVKKALAWELLRKQIYHSSRYDSVEWYSDGALQALVGKIPSDWLCKCRKVLELRGDARKALEKGTLGFEAALALARVTEPAREELITTLRPSDEAAEWPGVRKVRALIAETGARVIRKRSVRSAKREAQTLFEQVYRKFGDRTRSIFATLLTKPADFDLH